MGAPSALDAQRADSARAGVSATPEGPPQNPSAVRRVSPRRAFLASMLLPGSMQLRFDRKKAATVFLLTEAVTVGMSAKSWNDLRKAKNAREDTVITLVVDGAGRPVIDPATGRQQVTSVPRNPNLVGRIRARRAHLEDWLAVVVFNHLVSGADAYVAANLADFDANVQTSAGHRRVTVMARVLW